MKDAWHLRLGRNGIRLLDSIINLMVLLLFLTGMAFGGYALWDSGQLYQEAEAERYEQYKPVAGDSLTFVQLQEINPDVFGWLTVYGTNIDYPLVQGEDNAAYVNTSVTGESLLSGSIFLDYRNRKDVSDFNSILYGHHMDRQVMFGEIGEFSDEAYFEEHQYGNLYVNGRDYGIEFFAFLQVDAYDSRIYTPAIEGEADRRGYLEYLLAKAKYTRPVGVGSSDHLMLLSTCTSDATNGRHILVGKLSTTVYDDPFRKETAWEFGGRNLWERLRQIPVWLWAILLLAAGMFPVIVKRRKGRRKKEESK